MGNYIFHDNNLFSHNPLPCGDYLVYQIGEMYCTENTIVEEHIQICCEITFVVDGIGTSSAEKCEKIAINDCFFSFQDEFHSITTDVANPLRFHFIGFNPIKSTQGEKYIEILKQHLKNRECRTINLPAVHDYINEILHEIKNSDFLTQESVGHLISKMLILMIRFCAPEESKLISPEINSESLLVYKIIDYLDSNMSTIKNLKELEKLYNYNYNYMSSVFTRIMKFSINEYFRKLKMQKAQQMLNDGISITLIAEKLNYSSIHSFSRAFKKYHGFQPSKIKENT